MGFLNVFRNRKTACTDEETKWDRMWDRWVKGTAESPYAELMTYQSEINNGGHDQYFTNVENKGGLQKELSVLKTILPESLKQNLQTAYQAYLLLEETEEKAEEAMEQCDKVFYAHEEEVQQILKKYAAGME